MTLIKICLILLVTLTFSGLFGQKKGCTDWQANNYDSSAKINDGSCIYPSTAYVPKTVCAQLSDSLIETSGLIYFNNQFWTINDSGNEPAIYAFDSITGKINHHTLINNKTNIDWEEITQDSLNIYIGDFGNNAGDRKDLKIYILKKSDLQLDRRKDTVTVSEIQFNYADQTSFVSANQNNNFDMEAMCIFNDSIHLFSKDWIDKKTRHYILPKTAGNYALTPRESINTNGLITSACANAKGDKIILGGYNTSTGACFMWLLWDYNGYLLFNGNKRSIDLGNALTLGQYEATAFRNNQLYFTNEKRFTDAGLWRAEINQWFTSNHTASINRLKTGLTFTAFQKDSELVVQTTDVSGYIFIYNTSGVKIISQKITSEKTVFSIDQFSSGIYSIEMNGNVQKILIER